MKMKYSSNSSKRAKIFRCRDDRGRLKVRTFDYFQALPRELQARILLEAAVSRRVTGEKTKDVQTDLKKVSPACKAMVSGRLFHARVEETALLRDPTCRFLGTAETVPITWPHANSFISWAVTLGDRLYTFELMAAFPHHGLFVYNMKMDDADLCRKTRKQRKLHLSNRRAFVVNGPTNRPFRIVPCPRTFTLYILGELLLFNGESEVIQVTQDGVILNRWAMNILVWNIKNTTLSPSGSYLVVTTKDIVHIFETSTGAIVDTEPLTDENKARNEKFVAAVLLDDNLESLVTVPSRKSKTEHIMAVDKHQSILLINKNIMKVYSISPEFNREICVNEPDMIRFHYSSSHWFDEERGLVFFKSGLMLQVMRITY